MNLFRHAILLTSATLALSGCASFSTISHTGEDRFKLANVYRRKDSLGPEIKRVAVLPLTTAASDVILDSGVDSLEPIVRSELNKTHRFELIPVSAGQLTSLSGKREWRADEALPHDFLAKLKADTDCDAALFCELSSYQPYAPVSIGWKFRLVSVKSGQTLWAADDVFDGREVPVANAARDFSTEHAHFKPLGTDADFILNSPSRFGTYTLAAVWATLPKR
jgi:hypothetical protein